VVTAEVDQGKHEIAWHKAEEPLVTKLFAACESGLGFGRRLCDQKTATLP